MLKLMLPFAWFFNAVTCVGGMIGLWILYMTFMGLTAGQAPEPLSMILAIGLTVIPYCLAGALHRLIALELAS